MNQAWGSEWDVQRKIEAGVIVTAISVIVAIFIAYVNLENDKRKDDIALQRLTLENTKLSAELDQLRREPAKIQQTSQTPVESGLAQAQKEPESKEDKAPKTQTESPPQTHDAPVSETARPTTTTSPQPTPNPAPASPGPSEVLIGRTVTVPIAEGYYSLTIKSYKRVGTTVFLYLQYKNELPESVEFIMEAKENTLFDNLGNQYAASVAGFVGGLKPRQMEVLRGAFANAVLRFDEVSADAKMATALRTLTWWCSPSHPRSMISMGRRSYGEFENIPINP